MTAGPKVTCGAQCNRSLSPAQKLPSLAQVENILRTGTYQNISKKIPSIGTERARRASGCRRIAANIAKLPELLRGPLPTSEA